MCEFSEGVCFVLCFLTRIKRKPNLHCTRDITLKRVTIKWRDQYTVSLGATAWETQFRTPKKLRSLCSIPPAWELNSELPHRKQLNAVITYEKISYVKCLMIRW